VVWYMKRIRAGVVIDDGRDSNHMSVPTQLQWDHDDKRDASDPHHIIAPPRITDDEVPVRTCTVLTHF
jgi:hypothetical protein